MRKRKGIGLLSLIIGAMLLLYFLVWTTGILHWSFDIGVLFILLTGLLLMYTGAAGILEKDPLFFIKIKIIKKAICIACIAMYSLFIITEVFIIFNSFSTDENRHIDYMVIPGAQIVDDRPSRVLLHRLQKALPYLKRDKNIKVIVSGAQGQNEEFTEAEIMKRYLIRNGIDQDRIYKEEKARNSYENVAFSKEIILESSKNATPKVSVVTTNYHLMRMKMLFKNQGMDVYGIPVEIHFSVIPIVYAKEFFSMLKQLFLQICASR